MKGILALLLLAACARNNAPTPTIAARKAPKHGPDKCARSTGPTDDCNELGAQAGSFTAPGADETVRLESCTIDRQVHGPSEDDGFVETTQRADLVFTDEGGKSSRTSIGEWSQGGEWGSEWTLPYTVPLANGRHALVVTQRSYAASGAVSGASARVVVYVFQDCSAEVDWETTANRVEMSSTDNVLYLQLMFSEMAPDGTDPDLVDEYGEIQRIEDWIVRPGEDGVVAEQQVEDP